MTAKKAPPYLIGLFEDRARAAVRSCSRLATACSCTNMRPPRLIVRRRWVVKAQHLVVVIVRLCGGYGTLIDFESYRDLHG